jgi:hypothetical protein
MDTKCKPSLNHIPTRVLTLFFVYFVAVLCRYVTTTPFMPLRLKGNTVVEDMNAIAREIMAPHNIPVVDLYKVRGLVSAAHTIPLPCAIRTHCNAHGLLSPPNSLLT